MRGGGQQRTSIIQHKAADQMSLIPCLVEERNTGQQLFIFLCFQLARRQRNICAELFAPRTERLFIALQKPLRLLPLFLITHLECYYYCEEQLLFLLREARAADRSFPVGGNWGLRGFKSCGNETLLQFSNSAH